jgi:serine protease AprX
MQMNKLLLNELTKYCNLKKRKNALRFKFFTILFFLLAGCIYSQTLSPETISYRYLVYFKDKGKFKPGGKLEPGSEAYELAKSSLSDKALWRRSKVLPEDEIVNYNDLPVNKDYIEAINKLGSSINAVSKWFNAVSITANKKILDEVVKLDFVYKIEGVGFLEYAKDRKGTGNRIYIDTLINKNRLKFDYGESYWQNEQIRVPILHYCGITGWGVTVGMCDNGFNWREHQALRTRKVFGEHDWIFKDDSVQFQSPPNQFPGDQYDQDGHGTETFSTLGGFYNGKLIGPAFNSEFYLSKTEDDRSETPVEEDYWLEAAEWMEAKGVEVISSSLIYKPYDPPNNSYEYKDMNGKTSVIVRAAGYAAHLGVVVLNSMGNERQTKIPSVVSPADGDSVISVGAVDSAGRIAFFSSNGPTPDGRTKPDVVALGISDYTAETFSDTQNDSTYSYSSGTSFSCPLTAGVCSLILSAHPELTPMQVREALRMTASRKDKPDNVYGWGLVNAYDAVLYWGPVMSNKPEVTVDRDNIGVSVFVLSKNIIDKDNVKLYYSASGRENYAAVNLEPVELFDETNSGKYAVSLPFENNSDNMKLYFTASDTEKSVYLPYGAPERFFIYYKDSGETEIY